MNKKRSNIYVAVLSFLLCAVLALVGCDTADGESYLGFRNREINANVSGSMAILTDDGYEPSDAVKGICHGVGSDGYAIDFSATVVISSPDTADESSPRMRVEFTFPDTLKGLIAARDDNGVYIDLNGVRMEAAGDEYGSLLAIAEAFLTGDSIISVTPRAGGETEVYLGDSEADSSGKTVCIYTFSGGSKLPAKIDVNTDALRLSFSVKEN